MSGNSKATSDPERVTPLRKSRLISCVLVLSVGLRVKHHGAFWVAADGTLILSVRLAGDPQERVLLSACLNVPAPFAIFANGFE